MHDEDFDSLASERNIDARCDEFQRALTNGQSPRIESFLVGVTPLECQQLLKELLGLEIDFRVRSMSNLGRVTMPSVSQACHPKKLHRLLNLLRRSAFNRRFVFLLRIMNPTSLNVIVSTS